MKTVVKILVRIAELLGCYVAFAAAIWGIYKLIGLLPSPGNDDLYTITAYAILTMSPGFIAFGYSLLVRAVLRNSPKRVLIALLNGVVITAISVGAMMLFKEELGQYILIAPAACVLSIIMPVVMLALRPKSQPQAATVPEAEAVPEAAQEG